MSKMPTDPTDDMDDVTPIAGTSQIGTLLTAVVALLADAREADDRLTSRRKTEVLLTQCGLSSTQVAAIVGKQPGSVRTVVARARKAAHKPVKAAGEPPSAQQDTPHAGE
ncbi:hypothetical protein ACQHIV_13040 [Kribbella sp. GL6]|uniref:hypothetical protein n=1 Tax=Kribbella sp. GL6 TaxID=3419765 RepID=UPI003D0537BC